MVNDDTLNILYKIRKEISKSNNKQLLSEIDYTIKKVYDDLFVVSFIGHFSAGKSSLINYLLEDEVLPSSPIPTTSKTVQIEISDETRARVYIDKNHYVKLNDLSEVKQINKKDVEIEYVKIMHDSKKYNDTFVFQDTPGVDSKTSAHEESTHKFLLNSDYVFFTVEYNHVES
uniref:dynamin family protein n=1 Tax=Nosocomiicoccus massiliensis TaxID=1232430 RepID=UPI000593056F